MNKTYFVAWEMCDPKTDEVPRLGAGFVTIDEGDELNEKFLSDLVELIRAKTGESDAVVGLTAFNPC